MGFTEGCNFPGTIISIFPTFPGELCVQFPSFPLLALVMPGAPLKFTTMACLFQTYQMVPILSSLHLAARRYWCAQEPFLSNLQITALSFNRGLLEASRPQNFTLKERITCCWGEMFWRRGLFTTFESGSRSRIHSGIPALRGCQASDKSETVLCPKLRAWTIQSLVCDVTSVFEGGDT